MPLHPMTTNIDADHCACNAYHQKPMKQPGWQIPDAQGSFHKEKNKAIPQPLLAMVPVVRQLNRS
jgi:hypothetical protein